MMRYIPDRSWGKLSLRAGSSGGEWKIKAPDEDDGLEGAHASYGKGWVYELLRLPLDGAVRLSLIAVSPKGDEARAWMFLKSLGFIRL